MPTSRYFQFVSTWFLVSRFGHYADPGPGLGFKDLTYSSFVRRVEKLVLRPNCLPLRTPYGSQQLPLSVISIRPRPTGTTGQGLLFNPLTIRKL